MQIIFIALIASFLYYVQRRIYREHWDSGLEVHVEFEKDCSCESEETYIIEHVKNAKWLPLPFFYIKFKLSKNIAAVNDCSISGDDHLSRNDLFNILMRQEVTRKIKIVCQKRGRCRLDTFSVMANSLFLEEEYTREYPCSGELTIYPGNVNVEQFEKLLTFIDGNLRVQRSFQTDPYMIRGCREYMPFDEMRYINWGATVKSGEFKVNVFETIANKNGYIYLNLNRDSLVTSDEVLEESIRLTKAFAQFYSQRGIKSCFKSTGTNGISKMPIAIKKADAGAKYISKVNELLTDIRLVREEKNNLVKSQELGFMTLYRQDMAEQIQDGMVIIISNSSDKNLVQFLHSLKKADKDFIWVNPVEKAADFKPDFYLKKHQFMWRLGYEGLKEGR